MINLNAFVPRAAPPVVNQGTRSVADKIAAVALVALASLASFFLLPAEIALLISAGLTMGILPFLCCIAGEPAPDQEQRWYHPIVNVFHRIPHGVHPVVNVGPRAPVGGSVHHRRYSELFVDPPPHPRAHPLNAVEPPHWLRPIGPQQGARVVVGRDRQVHAAVPVDPVPLPPVRPIDFSPPGGASHVPVGHRQ